MHSVRTAVLAFLLCLAPGHVRAQAADPQTDARALILALRQNVTQTLDRLPRYLCTETVDRTIYRPSPKSSARSCPDLQELHEKRTPHMREAGSDRLRLDVAVAKGNEMFSWVGESKFQDRSLEDLVRNGATSTGLFSSMLNNIFGTDAANFTYNGDVPFQGRLLAEFGFHIPLEKSQYEIGPHGHHVVVGFSGTFLADPHTFSLVRLTVHGDQLPPEIETCESIHTFDYGHIRIRDFDFLIPSAVEWALLDPDGTRTTSRTVFSGCHEFTGTATLSFDEPAAVSQATVNRDVSRVALLPPDVPFTLALTQPINTETAAAGDPFQAKLVSAIRDKRRGILIPAGAPLSGRIAGVERTYPVASAPLLTVAVKLETITIDGVAVPFRPQLASVIKRRQKSTDSFQFREDLGSFEAISRHADPAVGIFRFEDATADFVIPRGTTLPGRTAAVQ